MMWVTAGISMPKVVGALLWGKRLRLHPLRASQPWCKSDGCGKALASLCGAALVDLAGSSWPPAMTVFPRGHCRSARWRQRQQFACPRSSRVFTKSTRSRSCHCRLRRRRRWCKAFDGHLDGAFVAAPIEHADLVTTRAFSEELLLISASRWKSLKSLREAKRSTGISILVFRTGCTYRQKLEQILTLERLLGCVIRNGQRGAAPAREPKPARHPEALPRRARQASGAG
jgi:hypothetical protein